MSIRNLQFLFEPKSVAVIGASSRPHSVGATVLDNLLTGGFRGPVYAVNPKYRELHGQPAYPDVSALPQAPDLAVICTPPATVPDIIGALGARGTKAAVVLTAGLSALRDVEGITLQQRMLDAARGHLLRILGPNCVGLLAPGIGLNASFAHTNIKPGKIAFLSQSGALVTGVLDWAKSRDLGFSRFVSLGDSADIDFGDLLDYLANDGATRAILMYIEDIRDARKFMSAARAAGRSKPVIVIKAGRAAEGARAAASHTGALAGADQVYDAAIRRAGMLRVFNTEDLFSAAETLARSKPLFGERLCILTNGGGPGVMATDALMAEGGKLATLSEATLAQLNAALPPTWSRGNPIDIIGDAPAERYVQAMQAALADPECDALLFIHAPTAIVDSREIAQAVAPLAAQTPRNVLGCWLGGAGLADARHIFSDKGIPTYATPEEAVRAFMQIVQYRRNQQLLMQVPPSTLDDFAPERDAASRLVRTVQDDGRSLLSEPESRQLLAAYGIPVIATRTAFSPDEAAQLAEEIGFPVALKILSPQIQHKSDVGGVALDLENAHSVRAAAAAMQRRLKKMLPDAELTGFTVQAMAHRPQAHELLLGIATDPVFGPVIMFGQGGVEVEVSDDHALELPPLNLALAQSLVARTRVAKLLQGYRNRPPADMQAIGRALVALSQLVIDLPEVAELDINPLLADAHGVLALDARVRLARPAPGSGADRLAIRPYPKELEQWVEWHGEPLLLRPIRPEDGEEHLRFFNALDPEDVRLRIFSRMRELQPAQLARLTQIDYDREMAFIASRKTGDGSFETLGVARAIADPDRNKAEFAIIVRSDVKGRGLGKLLMQKLIAYCRSRGIGEIVGEALHSNRALLGMVRRLGFSTQPMVGEDVDVLRLPLQGVKEIIP
jgi:acetyltransferase